MQDKGVYFSDADLERQIYLKEEIVLSDVGHFHDSVEFVFLLEGEIEARRLGEVRRLHAGDCIECGCCAYTCPANIPLLDYCKIAKQEIRKK